MLVLRFLGINTIMVQLDLNAKKNRNAAEENRKFQRLCVRVCTKIQLKEYSTMKRIKCKEQAGAELCQAQ